MSFNIFLNSAINASTPNGCANATYNFDFHSLSRGYSGKYKLTFKFCTGGFSSAISYTNATRILTIQGLGSSTQCFTNTATYGYTSSTVLGILSNTGTQFYSDVGDNPPLVISNLPNTTQFSLIIYTDAGAVDTYINSIDYVCILCFEPFEE